MAIEDQSSATAAWLVDLTLKRIADNAASIRRYATGPVTVGGQAYADLIDEQNGLSFGFSPLSAQGGIGGLEGTAEVGLINLAGESDVLSTHTLERMLIRLLSVESGQQLLTTFFDGHVVSRDFTTARWRIRAQDKSKRLFRAWPTRVVRLEDWPLAHLSLLGHPYPIVLGDLRSDPTLGRGNNARLAPCLPVEGSIFGQLHAGFGNAYGHDLYENINGRWAKIVDRSRVEYAARDGFNQRGATTRTITSSRRRRFSTIGPSLPENHEMDYRRLGDSRYDTFLTDTDTLHVALANEEDLGEISAQKIVIKTRPGAPSNLTITLRERTISGSTVTYTDIHTFTAQLVYGTGVRQYEVTLTDAQRTWDLGRYSIFTERRKGVRLAYVQVETDFVREDLSYQERPNVWMPVLGLAYNADNAEGASTGGLARTQRINNPVMQALLILRGRDMLNIPLADIDEASFLREAPRRADWSFGCVITRQERKSQDLLNNICRQAGIWLYYNASGQIACRVQDPDRAPVRAFFPAQMLEPDGQMSCDRTPRDQLFNYINLSYDLDRATDIYARNQVKGAVPRQSGDDGRFFSSGGRYYFESAAAELLLSETGLTEIYTGGGKRLRKQGAATQGGRRVAVTVLSGGTAAETAAPWWLGDALDADAMRSFLQIGAVQSMGGANPNFLDLGQFRSDYITDEATADAFIEHQADWHFFARTKVQFVSWWYAAALHPGDTILVDHPALPPTDRPTRTADLQGPMTARSSTVNFSTAGVSRGDYLRIGDECLRYDGYFLRRGQLGTTATAHDTGAPVYLFSRKFYIRQITVRPLTMDWQISAESLPE